MRKTLVWMALALGFAGCRCGQDHPTPVTLRIHNTLGNPIYVDDSDGGFGIQLQEQQGADWVSFEETPDCACQTCDQVCSATCTCDGGLNPMVLLIPPGGIVERAWSGVIQQQATNACGQLAGGYPCVKPFNPPTDETLQAQLCYALSVSVLQATDGGAPVPGALDDGSQICVSRLFRAIDGVVELTPQRGAACTSNAQCANAPGSDGGALCFGGTCTTACPANGFPPLGGSWQVFVGDPTLGDFFTQGVSGSDYVFSGSGFVNAVSYGANTMNAYLVPKLDGGQAGQISVQLPPGFALSLAHGDAVSVKIVDDTPVHGGNRAIVIRGGDGGLLLAADSALYGALLSSTDTAPFSVSHGNSIVGCSYDNCGKRLDFTTVFDGGATPAELAPAQSATVIANGTAFTLLNVADYGYPRTFCHNALPLTYVILNPRQ